MNPRPRILQGDPAGDGLSPPDVGSADLWQMSVAAHTRFVEAGQGLLDPEEQQRARAYLHDEHRDRYLATHIALRRLLGAYLDVEPGSIVFVREPCPLCAKPHGRPAVRNPGTPLHFSLSYGTDQVLFAVARTPVGVDIEELPELSSADEVATALHPEEQRELSATGPAERPRVFARVWARKEAYLKGVGSGIAEGLAEVYLGSGPHVHHPAGWTLTDLDVGDRHAACVATREARSW